MSGTEIPSPKSPWKLPEACHSEPIASFSDLMSEQLAEKMQCEEQRGFTIARLDEGSSESGPCSQEDTVACSSDYLLAQMLQREFDKEHDLELEKEQAKLNGNCKVSLNFDNYKSLISENTYLEDEDSSSDSDGDFRENAQAKLEVVKEAKFGPSGLLKQGDAIVSKHDANICGRKNASKVMEFPPEFHTGDDFRIGMKLPNHVYNALKVHSMAEERKSHRVHEKKERSTAELALDENTRLLLFKMVNGGLLESITGSISTGKEANVLHAFGGSELYEGKVVPSECAVKVFKTTLNEFKNRIEYVTDDYRFKNPRKVLKIWAEKEMLNLNRMIRCNIPCPKVVKLRKHVLVMSFIGKDQRAAPKLKEAGLSGEELHLAYDQCVDAITRLYRDCKLVHGDLSEFNILYWEGQCFVIDVGQATDLSHPRCLQFLVRDCHNLCQFFAKRGLESAVTTRQLFNRITGLDMQFDGDELLTEVQNYCVHESERLQSTQDRNRPADCQLRRTLQEFAEDAQNAEIVDD